MSNQNFLIAILFCAYERSNNYVFCDDNPTPTYLRARAVSYVPGRYKVLWKGDCVNFWEGSLAWKSGVLVPCLRVKVIERQPAPPPPHWLSFPNTSDRNFDIVVCSNSVKRSHTKAFGVDTPPTPQSLGARVVSYAMGAYKVFHEKGGFKNFRRGCYFFTIVQRAYNNAFRVDTFPQIPVARVVSYAPGHIRLLLNKRSYKLRIGWGSFDWKLEALVPFLSVRIEWRETIPSPTSLSFPKMHPIKILR